MASPRVTNTTQQPVTERSRSAGGAKAKANSQLLKANWTPFFNFGTKDKEEIRYYKNNLKKYHFTSGFRLEFNLIVLHLVW